MAGKKTTTATISASKSRATTERKTVKKAAAPKQATFADYFRFGESYTSLILGIIVVIIASLLLVSLLRSRGTESPTVTQETSSVATKDSGTEDITLDGQKTYTIQKGDDLWKIAQAEYNDGYSWVEIAKANKLSNPGVISVGTKLVIPNIKKANDADVAVVAATVTPTVVASLTPTLTPISTLAPTQGTTTTALAGKPTPVLPAQNNLNAGPKISGGTYTVASGDYLWEIAERAYGDGYKWVEIARANKIATPDLIFAGTKLTLPR